MHMVVFTYLFENVFFHVNMATVSHTKLVSKSSVSHRRIFFMVYITAWLFQVSEMCLLGRKTSFLTQTHLTQPQICNLSSDSIYRAVCRVLHVSVPATTSHTSINKYLISRRSREDRQTPTSMQTGGRLHRHRVLAAAHLTQRLQRRAVKATHRDDVFLLYWRIGQ